MLAHLVRWRLQCTEVRAVTASTSLLSSADVDRDGLDEVQTTFLEAGVDGEADKKAGGWAKLRGKVTTTNSSLIKAVLDRTESTSSSFYASGVCPQVQIIKIRVYHTS